MNRTLYNENEEQRFPYILPVLRSYKQNIIFEHSYNNSFDFGLPQLDSRWIPVSLTSMSKKKPKKRRKKTQSPQKNLSNFRYSPHFNVSRASSKFSSDYS